MKRHVFLFAIFLLASVLAAEGIHAQTQESIQASAPKIKIHTILIDEQVTVRNADGRIAHHFEPKDFRITDNIIEQTITHFELGGDSIFVMVLVKTSFRIDALLPDLRKSGSVVGQIVMEPNA